MKALKFTQESCVPCKKIQPKLEEATEKHDIELEEIDVEEKQDKVKEFGVRASPTVILVEDGEEVDRLIGDQSEESLNSFFVENVQR